jgi:hypothetical protein
MNHAFIKMDYFCYDYEHGMYLEGATAVSV